MGSRMDRGSRLFLATLMLWTLPFRSSAEPEKPQPTPLLSIDIRTLGFIPISDKDWKRLDGEFKKSYKVGALSQLESDDPHVQVNFISNDILAVSWTRGPNSEARWDVEPLFLTAVFIDTRTGSVKFQQDWPMHVRRTAADGEGRVLPVDKGRFVIHADGILALYTSDFQLSRKVKLPAADGGFWLSEVVRGGHQLMLQLISGTNDRYLWLDADTLQETPAEAQIQRNLQAVDPRLNLLPFEGGAYSVGENCVTRLAATVSPPICEQSLCRNKAFGVRAQVLNEQRVALMCTNGVALFNPDGKVIWLKIGSEPNGGFELVTSLNGNRVAVDSSGGKGSTFDGHPTAWGDHYFIYDSNSPDLRFVLSLPANWEEAAALSPDGSKFAVLNGNRLKIYEVPLGGSTPK